MPEDLVLDFVFVPHGAPWPENWVARHPDYITLPAKFVRPPGKPRRVADARPPQDGAGSQPVTAVPPLWSASNVGGVVSAWTHGAIPDIPVVPSAAELALIRNAVVRGLDLIEPGVDHSGNVRVFSTEFAQIIDPRQVNLEEWKRTWSGHTELRIDARQPFEHVVPGFPDYVVKFYPDDIHGSNMVVITTQTGSWDHKIDAALWDVGLISNITNAEKFCEVAAGCEPHPASQIRSAKP